MEYLDTVLKLVFGLGALLLVTRLLGKKEMGQFTPFDFVYALILGSMLEESLYDQKISIWQMLFGVTTWGILIYTVEVVAEKNDSLRRYLKGSPSVIIRNGDINLKELQKNHLEMEQLRTMLRQQGIFSMKEVRDLYLEPGGAVSVKKFAWAEPPSAKDMKLELKDEAPSLLMIDEGVIKEAVLQQAGKSRGWLEGELARIGHEGVSHILYGEWSETDGFFIKTYQQSRKS